MARLILKLIGASALALMAAGCASTLESRNAAGGGVGVTYMAPMRLLSVTATRTPVLEPNVQAEVNRLRDAYAAANEKIAAQITEFDRLTREEAVLRAAVARATTDAARLTAITAADTKKAERDAAEGQLATDRARAIEARVAYEDYLTDELASATQWKEAIRVTMGDAVGDPRHRFSADINDSWFRSDSGTISVGANGLLQSSNITVEGQLENVLIGVAETILAINRAGGGGAATHDTQPRTLGPPSPSCDASGQLTEGLAPFDPERQTLEMTFDPTSAAEINTINVALCRMAFSYRLVPAAGERTAGSSGWRTNASFDQNVSSALGCVGERSTSRCPGLVYRQNESFILNVQKVDVHCGVSGAGWARRPPPPPPPRPPAPAPAPTPARIDTTCDPYVSQSLNFNLPNGAPLSVVPYRGAAWVTRTDNVGFVDGSLVSHNFTHPSEAAAAARAPLRVFQAASTSVANAISSVVQLRIDLAGKEEELAEAQAALAQAELVAEPTAEHIARLENTRRILELQAEIDALRRRLQDEASTTTN